MKTIRQFFPVCITSLSIQSCGPDCDADCAEIVEAPTDFLDNWYFPEGSWWVYKLEDSSKIIYDTVYMQRVNRYYETETSECTDLSYAPCISRYRTTVTHSNRDYYHGRPSIDTGWASLGREGFDADYNPSNDRWYFDHSGITISLYSYEVILLYPLNPLDVYSYDAHLCGLNNPFSFQGKDYTSFSVCRPLTPGDALHFEKMTFAQGIGRVFIRYDNGDEWELIDYYINE